MKKILVLIAALLLATPTLSLAAVGNDEITSVKLKEADNTSGQNTNSGSGVKTGHIQNLAVTTGKIADGAVTDTKIAGTISVSKLPVGTTATTVAAGNHTHVIETANLADGAVTAPKLAAGSIGMGALATGAVTSNAIADGAVTDAKLSGSISTTRLNVGTSVGTVAAGDHMHDGIYQQKYANVIVVANSGGDYTTIGAAMNSITDASTGKYYLIKIMPGVYTEDVITMKSFVHVEGSGKEITVIKNSPQSRLIFYGYSPNVTNVAIKNLSFEIDPNNVAYSAYNALITPIVIYSTANAPGDTIIENVDISIIGNAVLAVHGMFVATPQHLTIKDVNIYLNISNNSTNGIYMPANVNADIVNTNITLQGGSSQSLGIYANNGFVKIKNSSIIIDKTDPYSVGIYGGSSVKFYTSILKAATATNLSTFNASASTIDGTLLNSTSKIVNCNDGNFNPIINQ